MIKKIGQILADDFPPIDVPVCKEEVPSEVAVAKKLSSMSIVCNMEAEPPLIDFWWTYQAADTNRKSWDIPANWYSQQQTKSQLTIASYPTTWNGGQDNEDQNLGWLLCWGRNPAGTVKDPCRILLFPEGPPRRPQSCKWTVNAFIVISCSPGFDGGSGTTYLMELWEPSNKQPIGKWSHSKVEFNISSSLVFPDGERSPPVDAHIVAVNIHGKSDATVVQISQHQQQQQQLRNNSQQWQPQKKGQLILETRMWLIFKVLLSVSDLFPTILPWLGAAIGVILSIAGTGIAAALCRRTGMRSNNRQIRGQQTSVKASAESVVSSRRWNDAAI